MFVANFMPTHTQPAPLWSGHSGSSHAVLIRAVGNHRYGMYRHETG